MSDRSLRIALAVLLFASLALPAQQGFAQADAGQIVPGDILLELSSTLPSSVSIDTQTLEPVLCSKPDSNGGAGEIGLVVSNDGSSGPFILPVLGLTRGELEDTARVGVGRLHWLGPEPFSTHCGRWSYEITDDRDAVQPVSNLVLSRAAGSAPTASFAGTVTVAALLRFVALDSREVREIPAVLWFDLAGRWTVATTADGTLPPPLGDGDSNLVLFVEQTAAGWAPLPAIVSGGCDGGLCPAGHRLVLQAGARAVAALNAE